MNPNEMKMAMQGIEELSTLRASVQALIVELTELRVVIREAQKRAEAEKIQADKERAELKDNVEELHRSVTLVRTEQAKRMSWIAGFLAFGGAAWGVAQVWLAMVAG
jgi:hypothetical protein